MTTERQLPTYCPVCTVEIPSRRRSERTYCSRGCSNARRRRLGDMRRQRQRAQRQLAKALRDRGHCQHCGSFFSVSAAKVPGRNRRYCGWRCYEAQKAGPRPNLTCRECEVDFTPEYGNKRRTYCSHSCAKRNNRRLHRGRRKLARLLIGGTSLAIADLPAEYVQAVKVYRRLNQTIWEVQQHGQDIQRA